MEAEHRPGGSDGLEENVAVVVVENGEKRGFILPEDWPTEAEEAAELGCELNDDGDKERQFMMAMGDVLDWLTM